MKVIVHRLAWIRTFSSVSWTCRVFLFSLVPAADCSKLLVRHKQMLDQRTMLLFSGRVGLRWRLISGDALIPTLQPVCTVRWDIRGPCCGLFYMLEDTVCKSPVVEQGASEACRADVVWCGRTSSNRIRSSLQRSWLIGVCRWFSLEPRLVNSCSSRFSTPQDYLQAYVLHEEVATAETISNVGARCRICSWCCLRAVRSSTASRLKHPDFGRPCLGGCLRRRDGWTCSRAGLGVAQWHSKETQFCLDSAWVCWRRTIRWSRWYTRQYMTVGIVLLMDLRTSRVACRLRKSVMWCYIWMLLSRCLRCTREIVRGRVRSPAEHHSLQELKKKFSQRNELTGIDQLNMM